MNCCCFSFMFWLPLAATWLLYWLVHGVKLLFCTNLFYKTAPDVLSSGQLSSEQASDKPGVSTSCKSCFNLMKIKLAVKNFSWVELGLKTETLPLPANPDNPTWHPAPTTYICNHIVYRLSKLTPPHEGFSDGHFSYRYFPPTQGPQGGSGGLPLVRA